MDDVAGKIGFEWLRHGLISDKEFELFKDAYTFLTDPLEDTEHVRLAADWELEEYRRHTSALVVHPAYFFEQHQVFEHLVRFLLEK